MRKLLVTIQLELDIPDTWNLVEHPDKIQAIKMDDGRYLDFSFLPMITMEFNEGARWMSEDTEASESIVRMLEIEDVQMRWNNP